MLFRSEEEIPFGAPVFMTAGGAVPFDTGTPQDFSTFLGFAVRVADRTPDAYPSGQFNSPLQGAWSPGDAMEILVRGGIAVKMAASGTQGGSVWIRKADGALTSNAGESGTTVLLENVRIRRPRTADSDSCEVIVNKRNIL